MSAPEFKKMSWILERAKYQRIAEEIEPAARVGTRDAWTWTALWVVGVVLTLGLLALKMSRKKWLEGVAAAVGPWQGYPRRLETLECRRIAHESRHTTQATCFGWLFLPIAWTNRTLRAVLGLPVFAAVYFVLPLPLGLAAGRFYLELDADRASWRLALREGWMTSGDVLVAAGRRAESLSRGIYLYAWPRSWAVSAYDKMARALVYEATKT